MVARFAGSLPPGVHTPSGMPRTDTWGGLSSCLVFYVPLVPSRHCGVSACRLTMASAGHVTVVALTRTSHALAQYLHGDLHY